MFSRSFLVNLQKKISTRAPKCGASKTSYPRLQAFRRGCYASGYKLLIWIYYYYFLKTFKDETKFVMRHLVVENEHSVVAFCFVDFQSRIFICGHKLQFTSASI